MKIERLIISGLRSHRGNPPTDLDLSGRKLIAIVGPTGAGKSSILEAICFALFGEATFGGQTHALLATDGTHELSVQMAFMLEEDHYQLVRTAGPNRQGVFNSKETWLRQMGPDGTILRHWDRRREVDDQIRRLLGGMDKQQFCQAVLLAQNRFAELLEANDSTRNKLLDILLGLTALENAREALNVMRRFANRSAERSSDRKALMPSDPTETARLARERATAMSDLASKAEASAEKVRQLVGQADTLTASVTSLEKAANLEAGGQPSMPQLLAIVERLGTLVGEDRRLAGLIREAETLAKSDSEKLESAAGELATLRLEHGGDQHEAVNAQLSQLVRLHGERPGHATKLAETASEKERLGALVAIADDDLTEVSGRLSALQAEAGSARTRSSESAEALRLREQQVRSALEIAERLAAAVGALSEELGAFAPTDRRLALATQGVAEAETTLDKANELVDASLRAASAAAAAHDCLPGEPCPVCSRELPADWQPPNNPDLERVQRDATAAKLKLDESRASCTTLERDVASKRGRLVTVGQSINDEAKRLSEICGEYAHPLPPKEPTALSESAPAEEAEALLPVLELYSQALVDWRSNTEAPIEPQRATAQSLLLDAERSASSAMQVAAEQNTKSEARNSLKKTFDDAEQAWNTAKTRLETGDATIDSLLQQIPERWHALIDPQGKDPFRGALDLLEEDKRVVGAASDVVRATKTSLDEHVEHLSTLRVEKNGTVDVPRAREVGTLQGLSSVVTVAATEVQTDLPAGVDEEAEPEVLLDAAKSLKTAADKVVKAATRKAAALRGELDKIAKPAKQEIEQLAELQRLADPDGTQTTARLDSGRPVDSTTLPLVARLLGAAEAAAATSRSEAELAERTVEEARTLDTRVEVLRDWLTDLDVALTILKRENFPSWARNERVTELVDVASETLAEMTGGRFTFGPKLQICDELSGAERLATTLSGGEKFMAALALALGVAEIAGRSGIRFDTLFLDEGFAGLDQSNLDRSLDAVEAEVAAGRNIVLITHIGAVAERIRDVLLVESDSAGGSVTRWLNEDERYEIGADLDLAESASG